MWMTLLFPHHLKLFVILLFILKNKYVAETMGHTNMSSCKPSFTSMDINMVLQVIRITIKLSIRILLEHCNTKHLLDMISRIRFNMCVYWCISKKISICLHWNRLFTKLMVPLVKTSIYIFHRQTHLSYNQRLGWLSEK